MRQNLSSKFGVDILMQTTNSQTPANIKYDLMSRTILMETIGVEPSD